MAKRTLLELTKSILSEMDSDEVTSITDTVESQQVATLIKSVYFEMMDGRNWEHLSELFTLTDAASTATPTHMELPESLKELQWITYNVRKVSDTRDKFEFMTFQHPDTFILRTNGNDSSSAEVQTVTDPNGPVLFIRNDRAPRFYTSFDDNSLVFDSFDKAVQPTLTGVKTQCRGWRSPAWTESDTAIPDLPDESFSALEAEAKSVAFANIKQEPSQKAEQQSQRQGRWLSRKNWRAHGGVRYQDYGRTSHKTATHRRSTLFDKN